MFRLDASACLSDEVELCGSALMEATVSGPQVRAGGHFWAEWIKVGLILNQVLEHRLQPQLWHAAERRIRDETGEGREKHRAAHEFTRPQETEQDAAARRTATQSCPQSPILNVSV